MKLNSSENSFSKMFSLGQPHKNLQVLLSILAFVIVAGSVIIYQIKKADMVTQNTVPEVRSPNRDQEMKIKKLAEVSQNLAIQPQTPEFKKKLAEVSAALNKK